MQESNRPEIALFDFDGTLTTKDSFFAFLKYTHGNKIALHFLYLWPVLLLYKLKIISNGVAKGIVYKQFYQNWATDFFRLKATDFCREILPGILNPEAIAKLKWHQKLRHQIFVVSAMFEPVLLPWCKENGIELIATKLGTIDGKLSGNFSSANCFGPEKAKRIKEAGLLEHNPYLFAYGDSAGDHEMLALADEAFFREF
jgi:phosphatidylglycerophosphatase C